jgi:hypothetical protein
MLLCVCPFFSHSTTAARAGAADYHGGIAGAVRAQRGGAQGAVIRHAACSCVGQQR